MSRAGVFRKDWLLGLGVAGVLLLPWGSDLRQRIKRKVYNVGVRAADTCADRVAVRAVDKPPGTLTFDIDTDVPRAFALFVERIRPLDVGARHPMHLAFDSAPLNREWRHAERRGRGYLPTGS